MSIIVAVDEKDKVIGFETRERSHRVNGILHRGFETLIFNSKNQLLIQRRSKYKKLWPGYWDASCCSHPFPRETYEEAGERRLKEELSIECELKKLFTFRYNATYKDVGSENEVCAVLVGKFDDRIVPNKREVSEWKFVGLNELKEDLKNNPEKYTPWFRISMEKLESNV